MKTIKHSLLLVLISFSSSLTNTQAFTAEHPVRYKASRAFEGVTPKAGLALFIASTLWFAYLQRQESLAAKKAREQAAHGELVTHRTERGWKTEIDRQISKALAIAGSLAGAALCSFGLFRNLQKLSKEQSALARLETNYQDKKAQEARTEISKALKIKHANKKELTSAAEKITDPEKQQKALKRFSRDGAREWTTQWAAEASSYTPHMDELGIRSDRYNATESDLMTQVAPYITVAYLSDILKDLNKETSAQAKALIEKYKALRKKITELAHRQRELNKEITSLSATTAPEALEELSNKAAARASLKITCAGLRMRYALEEKNLLAELKKDFPDLAIKQKRAHKEHLLYRGLKGIMRSHGAKNVRKKSAGSSPYKNQPVPSERHRAEAQ